MHIKNKSIRSHCHSHVINCQHRLPCFHNGSKFDCIKHALSPLVWANWIAGRRICDVYYVTLWSQWVCCVELQHLKSKARKAEKPNMICKFACLDAGAEHPGPTSQRSLHTRTNLSPFTKGCREWDASMWLPEFLRGPWSPTINPNQGACGLVSPPPG